MLLSSSLGQTGNQAKLITPIYRYNESMELSFYLFWFPEISDNISNFEIYLNELDVPRQRIFGVSSKYFDWKRYSVVLPAGIYTLSMVGTMGEPFASDIALASVTLKKNDNNISVDIAGR